MSEVSTHSGDRPTVLVGVCGGIAIYKSVELVRGLLKDGLQPRVVMTQAAQRFITPLTFAAASQAPVIDDESAWRADGGWFEHIEAARGAQAMVIAPATATTLSKLAGGSADNLLTSIFRLSWPCGGCSQYELGYVREPSHRAQPSGARRAWGRGAFG